MNCFLENHRVICFVEDHYNPLGMVRSLGEKGINPIVILVSKNPHMLNHCKYVGELHSVNSNEDGLNLLVNKYGNDAEKPFVLTGCDKICSLMDSNYNQLADKFIFFNAGTEGRITDMMNKETITNMASEVGLHNPKKEVLETGVLPKSLKYPVLTKTIMSTMGAWKDDVYICHCEEELNSAYQKIKSPKLLVQEYVNKTSEYCMEGFSINDGQDVFIPFVFDYIRWYNDSYGEYMTVSPFTNTNLKNKILELMKKTKYNGIFEIEFMEGNDDVYFLEVNFRNSTWSYAVTVGGGNLPYYWMKSMLAGHVVYEEMQLASEPFKAMVEPADLLRSVFKDKLVSLKQWIKDCHSCKCHYYYNKKDKKPFFAFIYGRILFELRKRF